jgi:hypothetical protein
MKDKINNLIEEILKIPGQKIVTLVINKDDVFKLDISENKQFGYSPEHKFLFKAKLTNALRNGGGMIIRQFLSIRSKRKMPNGKEMWIPEKNFYGAILGNDDWIGMDIQSLKKACETDAKTGLPYPREVGTHYRVFPIK